MMLPKKEALPGIIMDLRSMKKCTDWERWGKYTISAESRIRDTDMAETMVEYSKNNILAQAGQSMLAQANQSNQGVLSLLQ